jgi:hypothetical protein
MATTIGFVQRLTITNSGVTCALVGPAPTNVTALLIQLSSGDSASVITGKSSIVDGLTTAMNSRQQVQAVHGDSDANITGLTVGPG